MIETAKPRYLELAPPRSLIDAAHDRANREAVLEHARMGRSVCEGGPEGTVVWIESAAIFARYGLDEFGRPKA